MFCYCGRLYIIVKLFSFFPVFFAGVSLLGNETVTNSQTGAFSLLVAFGGEVEGS